MAWLVKLFETYEADAAIAKGSAVKFGTSNKRVAVCSATTDFSIGVAQNAAVNAGDLVEVVHLGGAKGLAKASIVKGNLLGNNADGSIQKVASANDRVIGIAMDDASAADIFSMLVVPGMATQTQS
jgi:hypothetical protein